jgi:hypothetical protein
MYEVQYNGAVFNVDSHRFCALSSVFDQSYDHSLHNAMEVRSAVPADAFAQFVAGLHNGRWLITEANLEHMRGISMEWKVQELSDACEAFERTPEHVVPQILTLQREKAMMQARAYVPIIAQSLPDYLTIPGLHELPPKFIADILRHKDRPPVDQHQLFRLIINVLSAHQGTPANLLFDFLTVKDLSDDELESVLNSDQIDRSSIGPFISQCAQRFLQSAIASRSKAQKVEERHKQLENSLQQKDGRAHNLRKQLADERAGHADHARRLAALKEKHPPPAPPPPAAPPAPVDDRPRPAGQEKSRQSDRNWNRFNWTPEPEPEPVRAPEPEPEPEPVPEPPKVEEKEKRKPPRERQKPQPKPRRKNDFFNYTPDAE